MEPYATMLDSLLDGEHSGDEINAICPDDWTTMLMPGVLEGMTGEGSALLEAAVDMAGVAGAEGRAGVLRNPNGSLSNGSVDGRH